MADMREGKLRKLNSLFSAVVLIIFSHVQCFRRIQWVNGEKKKRLLQLKVANTAAGEQLWRDGAAADAQFCERISSFDAHYVCGFD